jgi:hypothetical protein
MIDQIYNDFTSKLLPKIAEGFSMTKEYFMDLFGRYVKYLIVTDSIWVLVSFVFVVLSCIALAKSRKLATDKDNYYDGEAHGIIAVLCLFAIAISSLIFFLSIGDLVKDIYIPEIRVYEELKVYLK